MGPTRVTYALAFILALGISFVLTPYVRRLAVYYGAVDQPGEPRRIHLKPVPRWGGLAIYAAFVIVLLVNFKLNRQIGGLLGGVTILMVVGVIDDKRGLSPWVKLVWQVIAAAAALAGGIGITSLTNPFGGVIVFDAWRFTISASWLHFHISPFANFLSIVWMVGLINTINFLDGLDGLACGVSSIAALIMFLVAVGPRVNQPEVAMLAIILAGAALGFLPFNFFPARIFMGDSGAYMLGLTLALLAIYSGAKLATAALVLGFTIIDGVWVVFRRLYKRTSPFKADKYHLHHLLLEIGLSQRQVVIGLYLLAIVFGLSALVTGSFEKLIMIGILFLAMTVLITSLTVVLGRRRKSLNPLD